MDVSSPEYPDHMEGKLAWGTGVGICLGGQWLNGG